MSGGYGWGGRDRDQDFGGSKSSRDSGFSRAYTPYTSPQAPDAFSKANAQNSRVVSMSIGVGGKMASVAIPVPNNIDLTARKHLVATKKNVIILNLDRTGSMGDWRDEIMARLPVLFKEAGKYLGESIEIVFTGFGDLEFGDTFNVAPSGCGPELDGYLVALSKHENGGGNGVESSEMPAVYALNNIDLSAARNVFYFTVTDEGFYPQVKDSHVDALMGLRSTEPNAAKVFQALKVKAHVFTVLAQTNTVNHRIQKQWEDAVGAENVVELDDARRVVDVLLGVMSKMQGLYDQFSVDLNGRQSPTQYGQVNIQTVHQACSKVIGAPAAPSVIAGTQSLMMGAPQGSFGGVVAKSPLDDSDTTGGTRSLLTK